MSASTKEASNRKRPRFNAWPLYVCPECEGHFESATAEGKLRISLHEILHVRDRKERWHLLEEWRSEQAHLVGSAWLFKRAARQ
jgi:hypothetical protein